MTKAPVSRRLETKLPPMSVDQTLGVTTASCVDTVSLPAGLDWRRLADFGGVPTVFEVCEWGKTTSCTVPASLVSWRRWFLAFSSTTAGWLGSVYRLASEQAFAAEPEPPLQTGLEKSGMAGPVSDGEVWMSMLHTSPPWSNFLHCGACCKASFNSSLPK